MADNDVYAISYDGGTNMEGFFQLITPSKATASLRWSPAASRSQARHRGASMPAGNLAAGGMAIDGDDYLDRDTYSFTTGANTNELTLRVDWPDLTDDLDFYMTPVTTTTPADGIFSYIVGYGWISGSALRAPAAPRSGSRPSLEPSTTYWASGSAVTWAKLTTMPETYYDLVLPRGELHAVQRG